MRLASFIIPAGLLVVALSAGCSTGNPPSVDSGTPDATASPVGTHEFPAGVQGEPIKSTPAQPDEYGDWTSFEINGVTVEVPLNATWRAEIVLDPCFGDARYFILLEDRATADRLRIDLADPGVISDAAAAGRLNPLVSRVLRSVRGKHEPPVYVQTAGPLPTMVWCKKDAAGVPTLGPEEPMRGTKPTQPAVDEVTPPPAATEEAP